MDGATIEGQALGGRSVSEPALLVRVEEAGRLLGLGRSTVFKMIAEGRLRAVRYGRAVRVERSELDRWIREQAGLAA